MAPCSVLVVVARPSRWCGPSSSGTTATPASTRFQCRGCNKLFSKHQWKSKNYATRADPGLHQEQARDLGLAHWVGTAQGERYVASWKLPSFIAPIGWRPWVKRWWRIGWPRRATRKRSRPGGTTRPGSAGGHRRSGRCRGAQQRAENYPLMTVPAGGLVLLAGVDTQDSERAWQPPGGGAPAQPRAFGRGGGDVAR